jgi:SAM-dependent methyltransferase
MVLDFGKTAKDFGKYRVGFPAVFFDRLRQLGIVGNGVRAVDLGTGTGLFARALARLGCDVVGVDKSIEMIEEARRLDAEAGVSNVYVNATAEDTGLAGNSFDLATAGQCWSWFNQEQVLAEVKRLLKPSGHLVIANLDWLSTPDAVCGATEQLIKWHNPGWRLRFEHGLHPDWLTQVDSAEFQDVQTFSFDVTIPYSHIDWRGRIRATGAIGAYLPPDRVRQFDQDLEHLLTTKFPEEPLKIHHRMFALICRAE